MSINKVLDKLNQLEHYYNASVMTYSNDGSDVPNVPFTSFSTYKSIDLPGAEQPQKLIFKTKSKVQEQENEGGEGDEEGGSEEGGTSDFSFGSSGEAGGEEKDAQDYGKIYELKKIYSRLTSLESYLNSEPSEKLSKLRMFVSKALEIFEIIVSNFSSFKDRIDEIIIIYYKFLKRVYFVVRQYYSKQNKQSSKEIL